MGLRTSTHSTNFKAVLTALCLSTALALSATQTSAATPTSPANVTFGKAGSGPGEFDQPAGIAVNPYGDLYVADTGNNRIQRFQSADNPTTANSYIGQWGKAGTGDGEFDHPTGMVTFRQWGANGKTVPAQDTVYVADTGNNRIQKFDENGQFLAKWGSFGTGDGQFNHPTDIATDGRHLYVADAGNHRIQKFTMDGTYVAQWGKAGSDNGEFQAPQGLNIFQTNDLSTRKTVTYVHVADTGNKRIQLFTEDGAFVSLWNGLNKETGQQQLGTPVSLATGEGAWENLFALDSQYGLVQEYVADPSLALIDASHVPPLFTTPQDFSSATEASPLSNPKAVAVYSLLRVAACGPNEKYDLVYVTDTGNSRIVKYIFNHTKNGGPVTSGTVAPAGKSATAAGKTREKPRAKASCSPIRPDTERPKISVRLKSKRSKAGMANRRALRTRVLAQIKVTDKSNPVTTRISGKVTVLKPYRSFKLGSRKTSRRDATFTLKLPRQLAEYKGRRAVLRLAVTAEDKYGNQGTKQAKVAFRIK